MFNNQKRYLILSIDNANCCGEIIPALKPIKPCEYCEQTPCIKTNCFAKCRSCVARIKRGYHHEENHRCIVHDEKPSAQFRTLGQSTGKDKSYKLWAYDLEARIVITNEYVNHFKKTNHALDGYELFVKNKEAQVCNMVVFTNVFNPIETYTLYGNRCLKNFLSYMVTEHNGGYNICVAHNGSGYDSRLISEEAALMRLPTSSTNAGLKFTELRIQNTIFRDSLLHLQGSLASLAKNFELPLRKGFFPHLFNSVENYDYVGPIPDEKYFDLTFSASKQSEITDFKEWYAAQAETEWNFKKELTAYCQDDVKILALILNKFHTICTEKFERSPWFHATGPSYCHTIIKSQLTQALNLHKNPVIRDSQIQQIIPDFWAVLQPQEYWFARNALIGGRTDVKRVIYELSEEDIAAGRKIVYQDIVSMYPYVQAKDGINYPTGTPHVMVFDPKYYPCTRHHSPDKGNTWTPCNCPRHNKFADRLLKITEYNEQLTQEELEDANNQDKYFGIWCVTLIAPKNLFHPVLCVWDSKNSKRVASLENIIEQTYTSVEIVLAFSKGYKLVKIHRMDVYKPNPALWQNFIKKLYIDKMSNSEPAPSLEEQDRLVKAYEEEFAMGETVKNSFKDWAYRPALRLTYKIMLNSGWGKHCQRPNLPFLTYIDNHNNKEMNDLHSNITKKDVRVMSITYQKNRMVYKTMPRNHNYVPHDLYLPAGLFVPAYGRMLLYNALDKLKERVLYHDTDSIIYIYDPSEENLPCDNIWGAWDEESISKNGNILGFIGLGPKSYAIKTRNGPNVIKLKGISIKQCHSTLISYETLKRLVSDGETILIPQRNFVYKMGEGIHINEKLKKLNFDPNAMKGFLHENKMYPPGFLFLKFRLLQRLPKH